MDDRFGLLVDLDPGGARHVDASVPVVWTVLEDFGDIQRWSPGVAASALTSDGPVGEGSTRRCDFTPFGGVHERIDRYHPHQRITVTLYETFKLPISTAEADFILTPTADGTDVTIDYTYVPNWWGRLLGRITDSQMRRGIGGLAKGLQREAERIAAEQAGR